MGIFAYFLFMGIMFGIAMSLFYGLRATKII